MTTIVCAKVLHTPRNPFKGKEAGLSMLNQGLMAYHVQMLARAVFTLAHEESIVEVRMVGNVVWPEHPVSSLGAA